MNALLIYRSITLFNRNLQTQKKLIQVEDNRVNLSKLCHFS